MSTWFVILLGLAFFLILIGFMIIVLGWTAQGVDEFDEEDI